MKCPTQRKLIKVTETGYIKKSPAQNAGLNIGGVSISFTLLFQELGLRHLFLPVAAFL